MEEKKYEYIKVAFDIIDPDANPSIEVNNNAFFSDISDITNKEIRQTQNYATLEKNFWVLDGSQPLYDPNDLIPQNYTSNEVSNENGIIENPIVLTLYSEVLLTTIGLTLVFDSIQENYVKKLNIKAYRDELEIMNQDYELDEPKERVIFADNDNLVRWNRIEITFLETSLPYRRVRLNQLIVGILEVYTGKEIFSCESQNKVSMINSFLPTQLFKFTIDNFDKTFNPDNPSGWQRYLLQRQKVEYWWGYGNEENIEWTKGGNMLLTGSVDVDKNTVSFTATTLIDYLNNDYKLGVYNSAGISLYDLAVELMEFSGISSDRYYFDDVLKTIYTEAPLPKLEVRQLLQLIATTGNSVLYCDREGILNIRPFNFEVSETKWDRSFYYEDAVVQMQPELKSMTIGINNYSVKNEIEELFKSDFKLEKQTVIEVEYDSSVNQSVVITNGTVNSSIFYGAYAILDVTPTNINQPTNIVINGNKLVVTQFNDVKNYNLDGSEQTYTNVLVTQLSENNKLVKLKEWVGNWYNCRKIYTIDNLGDIKADCNTLIAFDTYFSSDLNGYLLENNIPYGGTWRGKSTVVKYD